MRLATLLLLAALATPLASAQIVINEVDADQTDTDAAEFVELYNAGSTSVDLSDHVLVLFNGNGDVSYGAVDLDGVTLEAGGYFVYCGDKANVANCDLEVATGTTNLIQNGADAVALFTGAAADFPNGTAATTTNLVDAIVYGTNDDDDTALLAALGETVQHNDTIEESIQRVPSGSETFLVFAPTPGAAGEAPAGPVVSFTAASASGDEGADVTLSVQIDYPDNSTATGDVVVDLAFDASTSTAVAADFTGPTPAQLTFSSNADETQTVTVSLVDGDGFESSEDAVFTVAVSSGTADLGTPSSLTLTIVNTDPGTPITIAEARTLGAGNAVIVVGTVSRAMGDFVYLQDATGGLTVRQTSGTLRDAVDAGTVKEGTTLRVEGTLSEFRELLQINEGDLTSHTVTGSGDAPTPQVVTLAELAANGESYEGELVTVEGATIDGGGDTAFAGAKSYNVSDASSSTNAVVLRISGEEETALVGTTIPAGLTNLMAVVGQFSTTEENIGYQLLPVLSSDIAVTTAGESGPEAEGVTIHTVNPLRAGDAVTLTVETTADVTLELFDVVGRRVATLLDGPAVGERTVRLDDALASGVYVLRLTTDAGSLARTITVVR